MTCFTTGTTVTWTYALLFLAADGAPVAEREPVTTTFVRRAEALLHPCNPLRDLFMGAATGFAGDDLGIQWRQFRHQVRFVSSMSSR